ncbi:MAG: DUF1624 domain-containing protein [Salinibacterium sp.]|nr:DUF1624 domain-containing protein [Salinibacterium sp.]
MNPSQRIVGVDIARGLAVLGMFGAHIGVITEFDWLQPSTWAGLVSGRSSILFATLAGVSLAIISGRRRVVRRPELTRVRRRIATRAFAIAAVGYLLVALGTNIAVILPAYAVLFILAIPLLRVPRWLLFLLAAGIAVVVPFVLEAVGPFFQDPPNIGAVLAVDLLFTGSYPAVLWMAFLLTGLGLGRLDLTARVVQLRLLAIGTLLALIGYGAGEFASSVSGPSVIATTEPHSGSPFEVIGSTGFSIAVLALCLLASRALQRILFPLAAVGSMALTVYTAQIVAIALIGASVPGTDDNRLWVIFVVVALVAAAVWKRFLGAGPLERLLTAVSRRAGGNAPADRLAR